MVFKSCSEIKLNSALDVLLLRLHYNNWEVKGRTPECLKISGHFSLASAVKIFLLQGDGGVLGQQETSNPPCQC